MSSEVRGDEQAREADGVRLSRRAVLKYALGTTAGLAGASMLSGFRLASSPRALGASLARHGASIPIGKLEHLAKQEGKLTVIALPPNWANYGQIISTFEKKYGIAVNSLAPDDSSAQELQAVVSYKNSQSLEPDAVDVGPPFAAKGKSEGLWAPYKVATWDTIPDNLKDPEGYWTGDYYGVIAFGANRDVVKTMPEDWKDLLKPAYRNMVSIDGDPRTSQDAFMAVFGAALANGGSLDNIEPGIEFFAELKKRGNFIPVDNYPADIAKGTTPIAIKWDYLLIGYKYQWNGNPPLTVAVPPSGVVGGFYCQAISRYAYHPDAARLWEEFLYSDEGQILYLEGYAHPVRYNNLVKAGKIPPALAKKLPPAEAYARAQFPTVAQLNKAARVVAAQWGPKVLGV
ncbi:MAG: ABC transporter substrate-binding protein [Firmicutes bacterium]|nr:ABC transporter substrate-binding protein [Bacillota bacterium]